MKLTTGIYISILLAGTALGQQATNQQASSPSWFDTLKAKLMGSQPKPTAPANNNAKPVAPANAKPSPAQAQSGKPVANTATAAKPQTATPNAKPAANANMASAPAANKTATAPAAKTAAASQPAMAQPVKVQAASSAPSAKATNNATTAQTAKAQPAQSAQIQPVKAQVGKATSVPVVGTQKPTNANINVASTAVKTAPVAANAVKPADAKSSAPAPQKEIAINKAAEAIKDAKAADNKGQVAVEDSKTAANTKSTTKEFSYTGQRDPFISPVRTGTTGSGCSTGKRCLAIDQINLKGVIKSDGGMIAVVTNALDKAYFLRENDPVFNGYVLKITGDSVVFSETYEDKLGKPLTREVTKKLTTPAV